MSDGKILFAHKILLSDLSDVFAAMLRHGTVEDLQKVIKVEDIKYEVMFEVVRFIYTGEVCHLNKLAQELLIAADKYNLENLKVICGEYIVRSMNIDSVVDILILADRHNAIHLKDLATKFFIEHKINIVFTTKFENQLKNMHPKLVLYLIRLL
ncbi:hypothetical protein QAD02_019498 [Eretmocerus hayati]|uniref:Uncharacterized protein n=1 Tax=Eretmocerus hayati TaxID=131215 RepID=A0ACC2PJS5_9HYME|nr:hypothetical protein QAD02_019498 [Eretmocerus hayati]